jgi:hypothetical protein
MCERIMTLNPFHFRNFAPVLKRIITIFLLLPMLLHASVFAPYTGEGVAIIDNNTSIYYSESLLENICDDLLELPCIPNPAENEEQDDANTAKRFIHQHTIGKHYWIVDFSFFTGLLHNDQTCYTSLIDSPIALRMRYAITVLSTPV